MAVTLIDAHAHFYECYSLRRFLEAAWDNMSRAANRPAWKNQPFAGCLMLAGIGSEPSLDGVRRQASTLPPSWRLEPTGEPDSLVVLRSQKAIMTLIAGRQIVTREGLEMLALATDSEIDEARSLSDSVLAINDAQGLAVFPWGFGKWMFRRGKTLTNFLQTRLASGSIRFYLGDNGGRVQMWNEPGLLRWARAANVPILAGSDPLPLRYQAGRVGSYGIVLPGNVDFQQPAAWIRKRAQAMSNQPQLFGGCSSSAAFLRDQIALRLLRRRGR